MMGPHWNPRATEIAIVLQGKGMVRVVCPTLPNQAECKNARFGVEEGDVFVVPRFHPMAQMAFNNETFFFVGFSTSTKNNYPQYLSGKASVLRSLDKHILATSFGVNETTFDRLLNQQRESVILECVSCAEEEWMMRKLEIEKEREKARQKEEEEARRRQEESRRQEEEAKRREEEEAKSREEAATRKREEEEAAARRKREEEAAQERKEQEERGRKEWERKEQEERGRKEWEKHQEEEAQKREQEEMEAAAKREEEAAKRQEEAQSRQEEGSQGAGGGGGREEQPLEKEGRREAKQEEKAAKLQEENLNSGQGWGRRILKKDS